MVEETQVKQEVKGRRHSRRHGKANSGNSASWEAVNSIETAA